LLAIRSWNERPVARIPGFSHGERRAGETEYDPHMQAAGFAVLGPLVLVPGEGAPVSPGGPKQRELLSLLLLHRGAHLSPERLVDALWGDRPPPGADVTLRSHVSHLRRRLADVLPDCVIETGPLGYALVTGELRVDADMFVELLGQGQEAFGLGQPDEASELLHQALALWGGRPWSDLEHVDAAVADATRLEELQLVAHEVLFAAELARGRHRDVVAGVEALHAAYPFRERFAGQLMLALYGSGRQADALAAYTETRERLADELGLDPGQELQDLSQAILRQDPSLTTGHGGHAASRAGRPRPETLEDAVLSTLAGTPLVGRERERQVLQATWRAIREDGARRIVLVSGEAGIGKSSLVADLVQTAVDDDAVVLVGRCDGTDAAYHPIADALRSSPDAQAVLAETPTSWAPLHQLLGVTGTSDSAPGFDDNHPPSYAAMRALLSRLAADGPVLLIVEDAEGLDRASGRLLRHVAGRLPTGVGLVVAYRDPPGGRHPPLLEVLGDAGLHALTDAVALGPLDRSATVDLIRRLAPGLGPEGAARLWDHTGGNPYFAAEMARANPTVDDSLWLPAGLRDVLTQRLGALDDRTRAVLSAAAVLGREVDFARVAQLVDEDEDSVAAALDEAVAAGFLVESGRSWSASYAFPHELMREATERDLGAPSRRRLHRRAADVLKDADSRAALVARQLRAAGPLADPAESAEWCLRAARDARALEAWDEAVEHAERAVDVLSGLPDRAAYADAAEETARLRLRSSRDYPRAVTLLEEALAVHVEARDAERVGMLHGRLGIALSLHHSVLDVPRALEHLDAAERLQAVESYQVHTGRTQAAMFGVRTALLESSSGAVRAIAQREGRPDLLVAAGWAKAWALFNRGLLGAAAEVGETTWQGAHDLASSYLMWGAAQAPAVRDTIYLLDPQAARSWCRRALGQPRFASLGHSHETVLDQLGLAMLMAGETDAAREALAALPVTALSRRLLTLLDGDWEAAEADWATSMAADVAAGDLHDAAANALWLAQARELLSDLDGAVRCLTRAVEIGAAGPQVPMELAGRAELARILAGADTDLAAGHLARCDEILAAGEDWRGRTGRVHLARAHLLAARGDQDRVPAALAAAGQVSDDLGLAWQAAEVETARAVLLGGGAEAAAESYRRLDAPQRWVDRAFHVASTGFPRPPVTVVP
jgi:DNA-binding SARP family transcriptional activator